MSADTPSEADVIRMAIAEFAGGLHTCLPGYVLAYDRTTQTCDVQPSVRGRVQQADGVISEVDLPALKGVPVAFPSGASFSLTFDLTVGDPVVVMFAERAIDVWKGNQPATIVGVQEPRRFDLSDAYAIPGGRPPVAPLPATDYASGATVLRNNDIRLGSSAATDTVVLNALLKAYLGAPAPPTGLLGWLATLGTWASTQVPPFPGFPPTVVIPPAVGTIAATKVKAE